MYLATSKIIPSRRTSSIEILAEKSVAFCPNSLQIKVNNEKDNSSKSFLEICNVTIIGEPQLINFDGVTNTTNRGNSLVFDEELPINWNIFGASPGQGLNIEVFNPHYYDVRINILLKGEADDDNNLLGTPNKSEKSEKFLFNHFRLDPLISTKVPLNIENRYGKFQCTKFQLLCFKFGTDEYEYPYIENIMINGEYQFENVDNINLNSVFFEKLKDFKMKPFTMFSRGTYLTLKNPCEHELDCYLTMVG